MCIFNILKKHGINNPALRDELQGFVTSKELESFENGVKQGKSTQAIIELKGRDRFIAELQEKQMKFVNEIKDIVAKF